MIFLLPSPRALINVFTIDFTFDFPQLFLNVRSPRSLMAKPKFRREARHDASRRPAGDLNWEWTERFPTSGAVWLSVGAPLFMWEKCPIKMCVFSLKRETLFPHVFRAAPPRYVADSKRMTLSYIPVQMRGRSAADNAQSVQTLSAKFCCFHVFFLAFFDSQKWPLVFSVFFFAFIRGRSVRVCVSVPVRVCA